MRKAFLPLLMATGLALQMMPAAGQGLDDDRQSDKKYQKRRKDRLDELRDENGNLRPDLWKKGIEHYKQMKFAAGIAWTTNGKGKGKNAADAGPALAGGGVQGVQWKQLGPQPAFPIANINFQGNGPMSGEVLNIAIDPRGTTDQVIYTASNDGGVWKSTDGGVTFKPKTDYMPSLSMGAVALDPANPSIVYAGTGNLFDGNGSTTTLAVKAVGIYRSVDGGESWTILNPGGIFSGNGVNRILVRPGNVVLVATSNGLYRSLNGGNSFGSDGAASNGLPLVSGFISDLDLDVANGNTIYASILGSGVRVSTDGGATFPAGSNLFTTGNFDGSGALTNTAFIAFAQSESNPQVMYVSVQAASGGVGVSSYLGLWRTADAGANWTRQAGADAAAVQNGTNGCQCGYDQTVGVDPLNENHVFIGFQELYESTNGGANFGTAPAISRNKIHWDHHELTWSPATHRAPAPAPVRMWVGTDGGIASSPDYGVNFNNVHNETIATNLFTDIDIGIGNPGNHAYTAGGTQDTGTLHRNPAVPNVPSDTRWSMGINGDGGGVKIDPNNPMRMFGAGNNGFIVSSDGGQTWAAQNKGFTNPPWRHIIDQNNSDNMFAIEATDGAGFRPGNNLWRSTDATTGWGTWTNIQTLPSNARAIDNTPQDPNIVWIGMNNGNAMRVTNALSATPTFTQRTLPDAAIGAISGIAINPLNPDDVVVTYRGVCGTCAATPQNRQKRVYRTLDSGATWSDISGTDGNPIGNLPNLPTHSVVFDVGTSPASIIISNDAGVLRTANNGQTWEKLGLGLPTTDSKRVRIDNTVSPPLLRVGTYGRSVFELVPASGPLVSVNTDLGFPTLCVGEKESRLIQVFNVGSEDLIINAVFRASGSTAFRITGPTTPTTIKPGEEVDWTVIFEPLTPGPHTAVIQISSNDPFTPSLEIAASGGGSQQAIAAFIANTGNFGEVCIGAFKDLDLTVANVGCGTLSVSNITSSSGQFILPNVQSYPLSISAGNSIQIPVRFQPTSLGAKSANITIQSNDPLAANKVVAVSGTVGEPNVEVLGSTVFGETCLTGESIEKTLTVRNSGTCNLQITSVVFDPPCLDFQIVDTNFPRTVAPGSASTITIRFTPQSEGAKSCTLKITTNDPDMPLITKQVTATLPGTILNVTADAGLRFLPEVVQATGACRSSLPFTVTNQGKCPVQIDSVVVGGSDAVDYSLLALPALSLKLQAGQTLGEGNVLLQFAPFGLDRDRLGTLTVNYLGDQAAMTPASLVRNACGEGVRTGARITVRQNGAPVALVEKLMIQHVVANRNGKGTSVDSQEVLQAVPLAMVTPDAPCTPFSYHREYGTVSNPNQLLTGNYLVTATIADGKKKYTKTVSFSVDTCDFNPQVFVDF